MHRVVAVAIPDVILFDLAIPAEVFGRAVEHDRYSFTVCTERPPRCTVPAVRRSSCSDPFPRSARALADTCAWGLWRRCTGQSSVADLASRAGLLHRTFARRFVDETGTTPLRWLTAQRLLEARRLLEDSDVSVEEVAQRTGLGTTANLRLHLAREVGTTPTAYRNAFRGVHPEDPGINRSLEMRTACERCGSPVLTPDGPGHDLQLRMHLLWRLRRRDGRTVPELRRRAC